MSDAVREMARKIEDGWNNNDWDLLMEVHDPTYHDHTVPAGVPANLSGLRLVFDTWHGAFTDLEVVMEDLVGSGGRAAWRYTISGTHTGEFMGIPATGKQVAVNGITISNLKDGKCSEVWNLMDQMGLMQQLGVIPAAEEA